MYTWFVGINLLQTVFMFKITYDDFLFLVHNIAYALGFLTCCPVTKECFLSLFGAGDEGHEVHVLTFIFVFAPLVLRNYSRVDELCVNVLFEIFNNKKTI